MSNLLQAAYGVSISIMTLVSTYQTQTQGMPIQPIVTALLSNSLH